jgi:hypothetical protein
MVVKKVRTRLEKACTILFGAAVSLTGPRHVFAHIIDERPGLGTGMTIILSAFWVAVVVGIVLLVRRLMRPPRGATGNRREETNNGKKD